MWFQDFQDGCSGSHLPSWIAKLNDLSNSESLCRSNASHQKKKKKKNSTQSNLRFGRRCCLKNFKMATMEWNNFSNFESLCHSNASIQSTVWESLKNFKTAAMAIILDIGTEGF